MVSTFLCRKMLNILAQHCCFFPCPTWRKNVIEVQYAVAVANSTDPHGVRK